MLQLQPFKPADAAQICTWPQNETEFYYWSAGKFGAYPAQPENMLRFYADPANRFCSIYTLLDSTGPCGHCTVRYIDDAHTALRLGFIILNPACRGKGYGKKMLQLVLRSVQQQRPDLPITLGVFAENIPAIRCYQAVGFQYTGEKQEFISPQGSILECLIMQKV